MAKNLKKNDGYESFVWKPRKPSCLNKDGTRDYAKLNALIALAQKWNHEALMLVFEQYSGTWQSMCQQSEDIMYRLAMDFEDLQQEAFCSYLKSVKSFGDSNPENFKEFFITNFKNRILDLFRNIGKQLTGHREKSKQDTDAKSKFSYAICSIHERYEEGDLKYDIPDESTEQDYFQDYYPNISKILTQRELEIAINYYLYGIPLKELAKEHNVSYGRIRNITTSIKTKLQILNK